MNTVIKISRQLHKGKNLAKIKKNATINADNGDELYAGGSYCTDFIEVDKNSKYRISGIQDTANSYVAIYDSNRAFIARSLGDKKKEFIAYKYDRTTFPNGSGTKNYDDVKYLRVTNYLLSGQYIDMNNILLQVKPYKNNYLPRHLLNRRSMIFE